MSRASCTCIKNTLDDSFGPKVFCGKHRNYKQGDKWVFLSNPGQFKVITATI